MKINKIETKRNRKDQLRALFEKQKTKILMFLSRPE